MKRDDAKKKKKVIHHKKNPTLLIRTSPKSLYLAMQDLSTEQKEWLIKTGFESILTMKIDTIPSTMAYYIVDNLDVESMRIKVKEGWIEITPNSVHDMLGVPIGGSDLLSLEPTKQEEDITTDWIQQFLNPQVRPMQIMQKIKSSRVADIDFKINFITLFFNTMIDCQKMGICNLSFLKHLRRDTDFKSIDWCKLIFDFVKTSMHGCKSASNISYYSGPITFLTVTFTKTLIKYYILY